MLGIAFLNEIVSKSPDITANEILNQMRNQVEMSLRQRGRSGESRDGMDVALLIFDSKKERIEFAGANNPLILIRDNELIEFKPDKMPIGFRDEADESFTNHHIEIRKGDMLYMFSDGYRDQLGGPEGKRFMIRNFRKLLQEIHARNLNEQKQILEQRLNAWIDRSEQVDDILVMGIRV
jgi:serine phosphatase RsbU (regulator of sigma subunit)